MLCADGKRRRAIKRLCLSCNKEFITRLDQQKSYCSRTCSYNRHGEREYKTCSWCQCQFYRRKSKLRNSRSGLFFCTRKCKDEAQKLGGIKEIMPDHFGTGKTTYRNKFDETKLKCSRCGYDEFSCGVDIHHIDENRENNDLSNLIPLCVPCHRALHLKLWSLDDLKNGDVV